MERAFWAAGKVCRNVGVRLGLPELLSAKPLPHSAALPKFYRTCGLSSQTSLLQRIHQSLIFRDQFRASLCFATLDFKEPVHQLGEVSHDFLQGWLQTRYVTAPAEDWSKVLSSRGGFF